MEKFFYYENGEEEVISGFELVKWWYSPQLEDEREQGTTFESWLHDLERQGILTKCE